LFFALNFNKFNNFNRNSNTGFDHISEFILDARNINLTKEDNMVSQTTQTTQPIQSVPISPQVPPFNGNDPFWIIIAIAVLVKVLVGNQTTRSDKP
jgi:SET domain-containing protein